ncbi:MAG: HAD-IC family P-type ATPase [Deltaproteobacteria bacterium]|nr:HAD-IC family P-type ATPase [Deltaproteobacteria bacterium]
MYGLLHEEGLSRYYELRGAVGVPVVDPGEKDRAWLEPIEAQLAARGACDLDVSGIHCSACVWVMEELFRRRAGAGVLELNPTLGRMHMRVGEDFSLRAYLDEVERLGYRFGPARKRLERASDALLLRTGVVMALAANSMIFSIAIYLGLRSGPLFELLSELSYGAGALSVLVGGGVFFQAAWRGLRARVLHLDLPIALGIALAFMGSSYSFFFGSGEATYVDTLTVFIALMLLGRFLQERTLERNRDRLLADEGVDGLTTRRHRDGKIEIIACMDIVEGDTLVCAPGDLVPVDALLLSEHATLSLDWIDGESAPSYFGVGETLPAGAFNAGDHAFSATATSGFEASCVLRLLNRTSAAGEEQPASSRFWQRVSGFYVIFVLAAAISGAVYWFWITGDGVRALEVATAILVVTCPCSFGIAVPLGYEVVRARLRRLGLFVRTRSLLDRMRQVRRVVFDKTGTLTTGALVLADTAQLDSLTPEQADRLYGMASQSSHPKARALAEALAARGASWSAGGDTGWAQESAGQGLSLEEGGRVHRLGSALFALGADTPDASDDLVYSLDGEPVLSLTTREDLRPGARAELERLEADGYDAFILSGDRHDKVQAMAQRLGVPAERALGEQRPEAKAAWVRAHAPERTLMLGDGLNDGLVVREALCSGTPAIDRPFMASRCDFYLVSPGLGPIAEALRLSRQLGQVVRIDLAFALLYNSFAIGLAMAGLMRPWLAAILMPTSSLVTIAFTLLALRERRARPATAPAYGRPAWT